MWLQQKGRDSKSQKELKQRGGVQGHGQAQSGKTHWGEEKEREHKNVTKTVN